MIETDLWINGGGWWVLGAFGFGVLAMAAGITWGTTDNRAVARAVGIPLLAIALIGLVYSIAATVVTHDAAYSATVQKIRSQGFEDPITIDDQSFTSGDRWCALKPLNGDDATVFKIVCEPRP